MARGGKSCLHNDDENNIQRVSESQLRDALDTGWINMIRCIILI